MAVAGFEYRIDGGSAIDAGTGFNQDVWGLAPGTYTFEVRGYDEVGSFSAWSLPAVMIVGTQGLQDADGAWIIDADGAYLKDGS